MDNHEFEPYLYEDCGIDLSTINIQDDGIYIIHKYFDRYWGHQHSINECLMSKELFIEAYNKFIKKD